jgi:hypothetical protein
VKKKIDENHPIRAYFATALHEALHERLGLRDGDDVEEYLSDMLVEFLHYDNLYGICDAAGRPVESVADMVTEGDVRLNADSFDREREVHRHIGDFLLFWSGLFPEFMKQLKAPGTKDMLLDPVRQGQFSYYVVSTFDHDPYGEEAEIFRRLSEGFLEYQYGLSLVRASFEGFARQGWTDGFYA